MGVLSWETLKQEFCNRHEKVSDSRHWIVTFKSLCMKNSYICVVVIIFLISVLSDGVVNWKEHYFLGHTASIWILTLPFNHHCNLEQRLDLGVSVFSSIKARCCPFWRTVRVIGENMKDLSHDKHSINNCFHYPCYSNHILPYCQLTLKYWWFCICSLKLSYFTCFPN